jgi:hypothetical protein
MCAYAKERAIRQGVSAGSAIRRARAEGQQVSREDAKGERPRSVPVTLRNDRLQSAPFAVFKRFAPSREIQLSARRITV